MYQWFSDIFTWKTSVWPWPFPSDQTSAFECYFLVSKSSPFFQDPSPGPRPHWRDSRASIVMIMEGDRHCLWFLGAIFKSAAIHPLRNIGGVSGTRLWANTDSTADSPRCPRCAETINGPCVANIQEIEKCAAEGGMLFLLQPLLFVGMMIF